MLRSELTAALPARFVGEELGVWLPARETHQYDGAAIPNDRQQPGLDCDRGTDHNSHHNTRHDPDASWCWVVDPHDGTRDFLRGLRGSSVSVALLRHGVPVLGVVHAPMPPDCPPDLIAWAEGSGPLRRNGQALTRPLQDLPLHPGARVLLSSSAARRPTTSAALVAPAQFVAMTSIAYRLARVAAGDAVATLTLHGAQSWDIAAGHALLRGAGGILLDDAAQPIRYAADGIGAVRACFGGTPKAARELALRKEAWKLASTD
jgi:myo-inositol-1(or 4)-monophosphatase